MPRVRLFLSAATCLVCSLGVGVLLLSSAQAQTVSPTNSSGQAIDYHPNNRTLTVHLNGLPLNQVMEELSNQTHIRFRPPPPAQEFDSRPVTASFERMPIERAIKQLLGPSNTAMLYGTSHASGQGTMPTLTEVRVLDLGVIPVVASSNESAITPFSRLTPEQLQARREEMLKRREERMQSRGGAGRGGGVRRNFNASSSRQDASQNPGQKPVDQSSGGQSSGNGGNNPSGGQPSNSGSNSGGNGGGSH